jgi:hypothetical protein
MKLFFRHKDDPSPRSQQREHHISLTDRNFFLLDENETPLKFRMNEDMERMVDEICSFMDISASDFIRQVLFIHLYGRYDLLGLLERQFPSLQEGREVIVSEPPPEDNTPKRAANIADFKVWLPRVMKDDLAYLAQSQEMTLSKYVRTVITTHLTGHPALACHSLVNRSLNQTAPTRTRKK